MLNSHLRILTETPMKKTIKTKFSHILPSEMESVHSEWPTLLESCASLPGASHILEPLLSSLVAQTVKCLPTMWETLVRSSQCLGRSPGDLLWVWKIPWRRKWQPSPVLLPGKSHGQMSMVGYSPWGCKELDTTEQLHFLFFLSQCGIWSHSNKFFILLH